MRLRCARCLSSGRCEAHATGLTLPMWQKAARRAIQEEAEAKAKAEYEKNLADAAERKAKTDAAIAKSKEQAAARAALVAEEKASREAAKAGATVAAKPVAAKYQQVEKVSSRAERIAARQAAGDDAPSLFGK